VMSGSSAGLPRRRFRSPRPSGAICPYRRNP
jgi:hypothetical protein